MVLTMWKGEWVMMFNSYEQLNDYVGKWISESDLELLWQWVQKGMVTEEQVIEITRRCSCDEECMVDSFRHNAWQAFIRNHAGR